MDFYKAIHILDLSHNFNHDELKKAYRKKSLQTHPDKNNNLNADHFIEIKSAYDFLNEYKTNTQNNPKNNIQTNNDFIFSFINYFIFIVSILIKFINNNNNKFIILKPSLKDIIQTNIYKFNHNNNVYYIPLWLKYIYINNNFLFINNFSNNNYISINEKYYNDNNIKYIKRDIIFNIYNDNKYFKKINDYNSLCLFLNKEYSIDKKYINISENIFYNHNNQIIFKNNGCYCIKILNNYNNDDDIYDLSQLKKGDIIINYCN